MLSYRPNLRTGKMERCDTQAWCQQSEKEDEKGSGRMSEGSHRIQNSWAENRYNWLNEKQRPKLPEWQNCGLGVKVPEDMEDATAHGEIGEKVKLKSWESDTVLKEGVEEVSITIDEVDEDVLKGLESASFLESVKARRLRTKVDRLLTKQADKSEQAQDQKRQARQKIRQAVAMSSAEWRNEQHELMLRFSRKQLLSIFIPTAGRSEIKAKPKTSAQKEIEKNAKKVLKSQIKSQTKFMKAKLAKAGTLKEGLAMGVSEKVMVTPKKTEAQKAEKKKVESEKRSVRRKKAMDEENLKKQEDEAKKKEGEEEKVMVTPKKSEGQKEGEEEEKKDGKEKKVEVKQELED